MPAQNWVPSVVMKDGIQTFAIMTPLTKSIDPDAQAGDDGKPTEIIFLEQDGEDKSRKGDDRRKAKK